MAIPAPLPAVPAIPGDTKWAGHASYRQQMSGRLSPVDTGSMLAAARGGDPAAFEALLLPLLTPAHKLAFTMLAQREAAEDAVQESALKAWRALGTLRAEAADIRPWFLTIVANQCRSVRRRRLWRLPASTDQTERSLDQLDSQTAAAIDLRRTVARLSNEKRTILALVYWLDLPIDEVAQVLGVSVVAARSRLRRAVLALRSEYTRDEDLDGAGLATQLRAPTANHLEEPQ